MATTSDGLIALLKRKGIDGKKVALFFTSGGPDEDHPFSKDKENPKKIKEVMFEKMENIIAKNKQVTIIPERFYCKGAIRMMGEVKDNIGHPTEEELEQARLFGEQLKTQLEV